MQHVKSQQVYDAFLVGRPSAMHREIRSRWALPRLYRGAITPPARAMYTLMVRSGTATQGAAGNPVPGSNENEDGNRCDSEFEDRSVENAFIHLGPLTLIRHRLTNAGPRQATT